MSQADPIHDEQYELEHHPQPRQYVFIGIVLAIVTAIEVGIYYLDIPAGLLVGSLLVFALIKFILVGSWFMHLKFDSRVFRMLFVAGIITALVIFTVMLVIFTAQGGPAPEVTNGG
jgi:cytochrome c oxidase subunit IV